MKRIEFDIDKLGAAGIISLVLMILKVAGVITCKMWMIFLPIILVVAYYFFQIFLLGFLIVLYFMVVGVGSTKDGEKEDSDYEGVE